MPVRVCEGHGCTKLSVTLTEPNSALTTSNAESGYRIGYLRRRRDAAAAMLVPLPALCARSIVFHMTSGIPHFSHQRQMLPLRRATRVASQQNQNHNETIRKVQIWKHRIDIGLFLILLGSTLSLDLFFCAVQPRQFLFVFASIFYFSWLSFRFRRRGSSEGPPSALDETEPVSLFDKTRAQPTRAQPFSVFMTIISIAIPWALVLTNERRNLNVLAPHLFLASAQITMEFTAGRLRWPIPARVLIPFAFAAARLPSLLEWCGRPCPHATMSRFRCCSV